MDYPTGTITFLFTDIEGSTKLWELESAKMQVALQRHDAILRAAIESHNGVVFKTIGDAFCAAFWTAQSAAQAMVDAQRALHAENWPDPLQIRVRMALHTGVVEHRDDDYFGRTLNRVARLLAVGHGGQCLVSESTHSLLRDEAHGLTFRSLGSHRLKDLDHPEAVFQVDWDEITREFPPLRSLDSDELPNNLPLQTTSFVGREVELAKVLSLLERAPLLTLTGAGGCGKSRLSLQAAAELVESFKDGVWFVEFAPVQDGELVAQTVAGVLKLNAGPAQSAMDLLLTYLKSKEMLLVLDNCEHLIADCARLVEALVRTCGSVRILCSSREPLGINGEVTYRVPSLGVPDRSLNATEHNLGQYASVQLFIDRALVNDPEFVVTNQNAPALADICFRLDGIPLAIELAAARIRSFSVEEISARLNDSFKLLTGGSRTALPRQQTLRSLIDWSYDLLSEPERLLFARLSCFTGGWSLEAAEAICAGGTVDDIGVLYLLPALVDKSLVVAVPRPTGTRFKFLETIRQYASERLARTHEREAVVKQHVEYFIEFVKGGRYKLEGSDCALWKERFDDDLDNTRSALYVCLADPNGGENACKIIGHFGHYFYHRGLIREGLDLIQRAIAHSTDTPQITPRLFAYNMGGWLAHTATDTDLAEAFWTDLMDLAEGHDLNMVAGARNGLGLICSQHRQQYSKALDHFEEVLRMAGLVGRDPSVPLMNMGHVLMCMGEYDRAEQRLSEGIDVCLKEGLVEALLTTRYVMGQVCQHRGDPDAAHKLFEVVIADARQGRFLVRLYDAMVNDADVLLALDRLDEAIEQLHGADDVWEIQEVPGYDLGCQTVRARALARLGRLEEAEATVAYLARSFSLMKQPWTIYAFLDAAAHVAMAHGKCGLSGQLLGAAVTLTKTWPEHLHVDMKLRSDTLAKQLRDGMGETAFQTAFLSGSAQSPASMAMKLLEGAP